MEINDNNEIFEVLGQKKIKPEATYVYSLCKKMSDIQFKLASLANKFNNK